MPNELCHTLDEARKASVEELQAELEKRRAVVLSRCSVEELEQALAEKESAAKASEEVVSGDDSDSHSRRRHRRGAEETPSE